MRKFLVVAGSVGVVILACAGFAYSVSAHSTCFAAMFTQYSATETIGLLLVSLGVGGFGAMLWSQQLRSYGAALIATAAFLPAIAALSTILIFLVPWAAPVEGVYAPFWGTGIALLAWVVLAFFSLRFTDAEHAIPSSYAELWQRLAQLKSQLNIVVTPSCPCMEIAYTQAKTQAETIEKEFKQRGMSWALAKGYISAWNRLHRAEEAMLEVAPQEMVIAGALNDVLRLQGSQIDHAEALIARLYQAIEDIDPSARKYLQGAAANPLPLVITTPSPLADGYQTEPYSEKLASTGGTPPVHWALSQSKPPEGLVLSPEGELSGRPASLPNGTSRFNVRVTDSANVTATKAFALTINAPPAPAVAAPNSNVTSAPGKTVQARAVLRDVRGAINEFRDGRWNGLVVARNRLIATMMFTGMTAYALLIIAIIRGASQTAITAAAAYYLVGATIGLLNQLRGVSQSDTAVEDYGLSSARLITMPLFCGLAAIGGVVVMAMPQMANPYGSSTPLPLAITTPSKLPTAVFEKLYSQRLDAAGGTPPYSWYPSNGTLSAGLELKTTGDLIAKLPKKPEPPKKHEPITFTVQVKDSTNSSVEKSFFLNITAAAKTSAETQPRAPAPATFVRPMEDIFDLHKNFIGLLLAAVFGLTPGLLFDRLQQQSEKYKTDLKSSEASQVKPHTQK